MDFARSIDRSSTMQQSPRVYWAENCYAGLSPFTSSMTSLDDLARDDDVTGSDFFIGADKAMFGVDYPHFESIIGSVTPTLAELGAHPAITDEHARKLLYENAAQVYGFDLTGLQPHIDRVGFDLQAA